MALVLASKAPIEGSYKVDVARRRRISDMEFPLRLLKVPDRTMATLSTQLKSRVLSPDQ